MVGDSLFLFALVLCGVTVASVEDDDDKGEEDFTGLSNKFLSGTGDEAHLVLAGVDGALLDSFLLAGIVKGRRGERLCDETVIVNGKNIANDI